MYRVEASLLSSANRKCQTCAGDRLLLRVFIINGTITRIVYQKRTPVGLFLHYYEYSVDANGRSFGPLPSGSSSGIALAITAPV